MSRVFWTWFWRLWGLIVAIFMVAVIAFMRLRPLQPVAAGEQIKNGIDVLAVQIDLLSLMLALFGAIFAVFGFFGYREMRQAVIKKAVKAAKREVRKAMPPLVLREMSKVNDSIGPEVFAPDEMSDRDIDALVQATSKEGKEASDGKG